MVVPSCSLSGAGGEALLLDEQGEERIYGLVGECVHLLVGPILNWMRNKHSGRIEAEAFGLCGSRIGEWVRGNEHPGDAMSFEFADVVHTCLLYTSDAADE